jgi:hypothetical protein
VASECDEELVAPPPEVEWLSECPLAEAASTAVECSAIGAAASKSAKALVEIASPHLNRDLCIIPPKMFGHHSSAAMRSNRILDEGGGTRTALLWERDVNELTGCVIEVVSGGRTVITFHSPQSGLFSAKKGDGAVRR